MLNYLINFMPEFRHYTFNEWIKLNPEFSERGLCPDCHGEGKYFCYTHGIYDECDGECINCEGTGIYDIGKDFYYEQLNKDKQLLKRINKC